MTAGILTVTASAASPTRNEAFKAYYEYMMDEIDGVGDGKFAPNQNLTRQEAAVILGRLAKVMGTEFPEGKVTFKDKKSIASWALAQVGQINKSVL